MHVTIVHAVASFMAALLPQAVARGTSSTIRSLFVALSANQLLAGPPMFGHMSNSKAVQTDGQTSRTVAQAGLLASTARPYKLSDCSQTHWLATASFNSTI